jgi:hypothetical protein
MIFVSGPLDNEKQTTIAVPTGKTIGIMLSSGADSAILLYMICLSLLDENRDPYTELPFIFTLPKVDGAEDHAFKVVEWINQKLGLKLPAPIVDGPANINDLWHGDVLSKSMLYLGAKYKANFAFVGDQQSVPPPYSVVGTYPNRYQQNPYPQYFGMPFLHLDKSHTIDFHFRLNTLPLLEISHSCTQQRAGRCQICYHCNERRWAFERLQKQDPGTN